MSDIQQKLQEVTELISLPEVYLKVRRLMDNPASDIYDFGTGYSSLSYLKTLPINSLKIDRGFIQDICSDENDQKIVQTLISMAHSMEMKVVAEGVENNAQFDLLGEYAIDEIQGYLLSKPVDAESIETLIQSPLPKLGSTANVVQLRP